MPKKLPQEFYLREDTLTIARELLGKVLVVPDEKGNRISGRIVETEAYLGEEDRAAHSYGGRRTKRTEVAYGHGGSAYVFLIYGMYHQFNVVTGPSEHPHVVLIRALEPLENLEVMRSRRRVAKDRDLTNGPGKLCIALGIDQTFYGADLTGDRIWIEDGPGLSPDKVTAAKRIGINYAGEYADRLWRYYEKDNPFVSKK
jgi:DNA-3-methyladenine glycosylase